mmetsp:Transcript_53227/g.84892  ORF Transcript_53227/g.84892 Transcript_53227/m.84892 type:complete len:201 (-) Transcript_53227:185-787(-)
MSHRIQHSHSVVPGEGRGTAQQNVHDDANAPNVAQLVVTTSQHLRSHVVRSACLGGGKLPRAEAFGEAEVDQLQIGLLNGSATLCQQPVFRFQITVHDTIDVHVIHRPQHLLHTIGGHLFGELAIGHNPVKELSARAQLQHQVDISLIVERLLQSHNVGVVQQLHDRHLLLKLLRVFDELLVDRLDSSPLSSILVHALLD